MGAETGAEIARGSLVELHLALTLSDGTEALSTFGEPPLPGSDAGLPVSFVVASTSALTHDGHRRFSTPDYTG